MKPDKAIEILSDPVYDTYRTVNPDFPDAIRLGIEALKRIKELRHIEAHFSLKELPGEDPE